MKNLALLSVFILFVFPSLQAQLEKGSMLIGGSAYLSGGGINSNSFQYNTGVQPSGGFFLASKFAIGSSLGFSCQGQKSSGNQKYSFFGIGLSPFARYYFLKVEKKVNLFSQVGFGFSQGWSRNNGTTSSGFYVSPNASLGLAYFLRPQIALEARLNVDHKFFSSGWMEKGVQLNMTLGFQIHLNKVVKDAK